MSPRARALLWTAAVLLADRITKLMIEARVAPWETIVLIPGFFQIIHTENPGIVFGLLAGGGGALQPVLLGVAATAVLLGVFVYFWRLPAKLPSGQKYARTALALVLGGAAGNLYDRVTKGSVTDFLDFHLAGWHWPAFNIADSAITVGVLLLLVDFARARPPQESPPR